MKKILLMVLLTISVSANQSFFKQSDKQLHIGFSYFVGMASTSIAKKEFNLTNTQSFWAGLASAIVVGVVKEKLDKNKGGIFDTKDILADVIGGVAGAGTSFLIYEYKF